MTLLILVGVWSLIFGHMNLTPTLRMKNNEARLFGAVLIALAAYGLPYLNGWIAPHIPHAITHNDTFREAFDLAIGGLVVYGAAFLMTRSLPRIKVPSINVSFKRLRA